MLLLLIVGHAAFAEPDLTIQDTAVHSGSWREAYARILEEHSAGIQAYEDYVPVITEVRTVRPVGLPDLTGDGIPELLFLDLIDDTEYGFKVGRLWIYTPDGNGVHCALTLQPEIDDLLYSQVYLAKNGTLTIYFADTERGWILQLTRDRAGRYVRDTLLTSEEDFSGEGPDRYYRNGADISAKKYRSLTEQIRESRGVQIGSLMVDEYGNGFTHTLAEAKTALAGGEPAASASPSGGLLPELSFARATFTPGEKFAVYSAPSARSWRGANGKASITSASEIDAAGVTDGWLLVMYELSSGVTRVGYIDVKKIREPYTAEGRPALSHLPMTLKDSAVLTDDPVQAAAVGTLRKGSAVTCLAEYQGWIYVEAKVNGKTARGFIPPAALGWPETR